MYLRDYQLAIIFILEGQIKLFWASVDLSQ